MKQADADSSESERPAPGGQPIPTEPYGIEVASPVPGFPVGSIAVADPSQLPERHDTVLIWPASNRQPFIAVLALALPPFTEAGAGSDVEAMIALAHPTNPERMRTFPANTARCVHKVVGRQ